MRIIQEPDKRLHTVSSKVENFDEAKKIAEELIRVTEKMDRPWKFWWGMAAPQIGYNKRLFILRTWCRKYKVIVNPEVLEEKLLLPLLSKCYSSRGHLYITKYHF